MTSKNLQLFPHVDLRYRVWFNPNLKSEYFMGLTELFSVITMLSILLPAAALVREKEYGTIEQLLVTPLLPYEIMLAKIIPMGAIVFLATFIAIFSVLKPIFGIPILGSLWLLKGVGFRELWREFLGLFVLGGLAFLLGVVKFRSSFE
jgi:ABC-2 type transport system permease protein